MKVLFLQKNTGMQERLGIMTLSSIIKDRKHEAKLILTEEYSDEEIVAKVKEYAPKVIAYSIMTGEHNYHLDLNKMIKKHYKCFSVFGGPHATFHPSIIRKEGVDAVCRGEGDIAFPELLEKLEHGENYLNINNFFFKKSDGTIIRNELGPLVEDLDSLPFPDREIMYSADPVIASKGNKLFMAMRGCPYNCTYCFNHTYNRMTRGKGSLLRYRSVDNLIAEMKQVKANYGLDNVCLDDDTFLLKPKGWLKEFAEKFSSEINLPFSCNVRANLMCQEEIGRLLKKAGCKYVWMGVECGNNEVADKILRRSITNEQILQSSEILRKNKINIFTQNLIGLPVENPLEVDFETLDFNIKVRPQFAWSSILYPYPGTEIEQIAIEKGMFNSDFEKIHVSNKTTSILDFGNKKLNRQIINLHKLFGIIVQFPVLRPFTKLLISLPLSGLYTWIFFGFYGYKSVLKQSSWRNLAKTFRHYIPFYFKYITKLEKH
ncbi:MAG: radical SAM protein [Patescibacteria group bacterium]